MSTRPKARYRKVRRVALLYDLDLLSRETLLRVDLTIESGDGITTPIVPLYSDRFTSDNPNALAPRGFSPRQLTTCFELEETVVNRTVFNPYRPANPDHNELTKQLYNLAAIKTLRYTGETHERGFERFT